MPQDYYSTLGVPKSATAEEIKKAFHKLAHQYHPDKKGGDVNKFKEINEAYQVLSNSEKRRNYDQFGSAGGPGFGGQGSYSGQGNPFGGFDFGGGNPFGNNAHGAQFDFSDLGDIFDAFGFGGGRTSARKKRANRGHDLELRLAISFADSVFGLEKNISYEKNVDCAHCGGSGAEPGTKIKDCPACGGRGMINRIQRTILGDFQTQTVCPDCQGEGKQAEKKCSQCRGAGINRQEVSLKVKIPAGIASGQTIELPGEGEAIGKGGKSGNLYLVIEVEPDPRFARQGDDILSTINLSIIQAALGDKIEVETVDGPVKLKIPEGTQNGAMFRLAGKGVPHLKRYGRGDHLIEAKVIIPKNLNKKQRVLLEEFKKIE